MLNTVSAEEPEEPGEPCSKALGFNESSGPKDRSNQDLSFCDEHHKRTCCERNHTKQVRTAFAGFSHERSGRCAQMGRLAFCSICDGDVGIGIKAQDSLVVLCPSFCRLWFESCAQDFFAPGTSAAKLTDFGNSVICTFEFGGRSSRYQEQGCSRTALDLWVRWTFCQGSVAPCGPSALVCSPLSEITEDPAAFCSGAGFEVAESEDAAEEPCFDGVPAAKMRGKAPRAPWTPPRRKEPSLWRRAMDSWYRSGVPFWLEENAPGLAIAIVAAAVGWCQKRDVA
ncbi:unnamed protein product [Durusdinium trenchii]|uniref:Folate receptor-like domain-containing protein n=1 Tax=Durusdinium trenchii TaxID=1381693 RepID=A0ABP0LNA3_9DINO